MIAPQKAHDCLLVHVSPTYGGETQVTSTTLGHNQAKRTWAMSIEFNLPMAGGKQEV